MSVLTIAALFGLSCKEDRVATPEPVETPVAETTRWTTQQGLPGDMVRALTWHNGTLTGAALRGSKTVGLFSLDDNTIQPIPSPTQARTHALRSVGGQLVVGAADGLWVQADGQWRALTDAPIQALFPYQQGALALVGERRKPTLYALKDSALAPLSAEPCVEPVTVLSGYDAGFWLVCRSAIFRGQDGLRPYGLEQSVLWRPAEDGSAPPVYLYDATVGPDGALYVVGKTSALVRVTADGVESIASGAFATVERSEASLFMSTFDGAVHRWSPGGGLQQLISVEGERIDAMAIDQEERLFVVSAPRSQPHRLERWSPPYDGPDRVWSLAVDQSLSPGVVAIHPDQQGGVLLETNRGLWHLQ